MKAIFDEWDIAKTESILKDRELDDNLRAAKTQKRRDAEKKGKEDELSQVQKEFDVAQKQVNKCYCEVEKRISEHDNAVIAGFEKLDITEGMVLIRISLEGIWNEFSKIQLTLQLRDLLF